MTRDIEAPEAVLIWNSELGGASVAVPVNAISAVGEEAIQAIGFDEDLGTEGLGYVQRSDGSRLILTGISAESVREVLDLDVVVAFEVLRGGADAYREYPIDVLAAPAAAPGL